MTHSIDKCECGKIIRQCRCLDLDKQVNTISPCTHSYTDLAREFDQLVRDEAERIGVKDWFAAGHAARTIAADNPDLIIALGQAVKSLKRRKE